MCISNTLNHKIREMMDEYMDVKSLAVQNKLLNISVLLNRKSFLS